MGTFVWELSLRNLRLETLAWELLLGNFSSGNFVWELSLGTLAPESQAGGTGLLGLGEPAGGFRGNLAGLY